MLLVLAGAFGIASVGSFAARGATRVTLTLLLLAALALYLFAASLDPFLHPWDEQFHALVAKNMLLHPLRPTLYEHPVLPYDFRVWTQNHVWLHKQPLALWQIMVSLGVLGAHEMAVRLPSAILATAFVLVTFRIGRLLAGRTSGYCAALLAASSPYSFGLVAGRLPLDHVDVAFVFYVTASLWALVEYTRRPRLGWALLSGTLAGLAVLTKWLVGLLVFPPWVLILARPRIRPPGMRFAHLILAASLTGLVAGPWQVYTLLRFPDEARQELWYSSLHLFHAVEGHGGGWLYHFGRLTALYGKAGAVLLAPALVLLWLRLRPVDRTICFVPLLFTYGLFSLAATKMPSYCLIVSAVVYAALGTLLGEIIDRLRRLGLRPGWEPVLVAVALTLVSFFSLNLPKRLTARDSYDALAAATAAYKASRILPGGLVVLADCPKDYAAAAMFYTNAVAYDHAPSAEERSSLRRAGAVVRGCLVPELSTRRRPIATAGAG